MASIDRYRPPREGYQPPSLPPKPPERHSKSPSRRRDVPPAVPSPPTHTSRTSPPRPASRRSAPSPTQSSPATGSRPRTSQWYFTADEALSSPSIIDGLSPAEERLRRAKGVNFIYQVGVLLDLPQITFWVAGVFFHRFYMRFSMVEEKQGIHHYTSTAAAGLPRSKKGAKLAAPSTALTTEPEQNIAATALFLANKTEENCRKTKDLIIAVAKIAQKNTKLIIDEQSKEYWRWRDSILMYEELMLELLTFDLMVENPYQKLYEQLGMLEIVHNKRLREAAWAFCNDACLTVLPLLMEPRDVAIAAIFFATTLTNEKIDDINGEAWWKYLKADEERTVKAINLITDFYSENPLRKQDTRYQGSPEFNLESTRRRGETILSQTEAGSSYNGTPAAERATQSPGYQANGRAEREDEDINKDDTRKEGEDADHEIRMVSATAPGDSDAVLKAAANDLDHHTGKPNGTRIPSPGQKRNGHQADLDPDSQSQSQKRPRLSEEDEGEVLE